MLHRLLRSYQGFVTTMMVSRPLTFDKLAPLLLPEEAREHIYNKSEEKAMTVKDKGKKVNPRTLKQDPMMQTRLGRRTSSVGTTRCTVIRQRSVERRRLT